MVGLTLLCMAFVACGVGTLAHFSILGRLQNAHVSVKFFANVSDTLRAYKKYRDMARSEGWPIWLWYAALSSYVGLALAFLSYFFDSPVSRILKSMPR